MDAAGGGSIRSLPSIMSPKSLLGRSSAKVGIANEFTELPTSAMHREVLQAARLQASSSDDANIADQPPNKRPDGQKRAPLDQRYCCCLTFCSIWIFTITVALGALWFYYLAEPNGALRHSINDLDARLQRGLSDDFTLVSNAATTMALQSDHMIQQLNACQARLQLAEFKLSNTSDLSNQTRTDTDNLLAHVQLLQASVTYLLGVQAAPRLAALESRAAFSEANITNLHHTDEVTMNRTAVLEARADNHELRLLDLEANAIVLATNVSVLQRRADVAQHNISVLQSRQDVAEAKIDVLTVNMTRSMNVIVLLEELASDGLRRISLIENFTVPSLNMTRTALLPMSTVAELQSHSNRVNALVSVGADFVVASASSDVTIKFWDVRQGLLLGTLTTNVGTQGGGHSARVNCLVSLANSMLVSGGSDASIIIWDTTDVRQVYRMAVWNAHLSEVLSLSCRSRAGPLVFSGGDDNVIKAWLISTSANGLSRTATANQTGTFGVFRNTDPLLGHTAPVTATLVTTSGLLVSGSQDGVLIAWDVATTLPLRRLSPLLGTPVITAVRLVPPSAWYPTESVAVGYLDSNVRLWDVVNGVLVKAMPVTGATGVYAMAVLPDMTLVAGGGDGSVSLWNPVTAAQWSPALQHAAPSNGSVYCTIVLPSGQLLTAGDDGKLVLWSHGYVPRTSYTLCKNC